MGGGRLGEGNNFYQKNNSPFGRLSFVSFGRVLRSYTSIYII